MIKDLKLAFQCIKYGYRIKMLSIVAVMFLCMCALQLSFERTFNYVIAGFMLAVIPSLICQMYRTVSMSNLVLASPKKKRMEIGALSVLCCLCQVVLFLVYGLALFIVYQLGHLPAEQIGYLLLVYGLINIVVMVYVAFSYKYYVISSVIFGIGFMALYIVAISVVDTSRLANSVPILVGAGIAAAEILVGCLVFYSITKLIYKRPMDKLAMQSVMKADL